MAKNKDTADQLSAHELLEARVDAMMDPEVTKSTSASELARSAPLLPGAKSKVTSNPGFDQSTPSTVTPMKPGVDQSPEIIAINPGNLDTPKSDAAIDDIVAQEADEVLAAEDAGLAAAQAQQELPDEPKKRGHPIFWFMILVMATVAIIAAVMLTNPNLSLPFEA